MTTPMTLPGLVPAWTLGDRLRKAREIAGLGGHLSPEVVGRAAAKALGDGWTAHTLRHRFATGSLAYEGNLRAVQKLLGHTDPKTTAVYTAVADDTLTATVNAL